jgi:hypothetical protein
MSPPCTSASVSGPRAPTKGGANRLSAQPGGQLGHRQGREPAGDGVVGGVWVAALPHQFDEERQLSRRDRRGEVPGDRADAPALAQARHLQLGGAQAVDEVGEVAPLAR